MSDLFGLYQMALPRLLQGALVTLKISGYALIIGAVAGVILGMLNSKRLRTSFTGYLIDLYVGIMRGTPLFVQVLIAYFGIPEVTGLNLSPLQAGACALGLNSAAYLAEIVRGGINAIPRGQWEACLALGYTKRQALRYVIVPQAAWNTAPAVVNEMISLVKESSILLILGVPELTKVSKDFVSFQLKPMEIYILCALIYLAMTSLLHFTGRLVERSKPWSC